jgi:hypothetical protein
MGAELRSHDDPILDRIPTEGLEQYKARTVGVSSSDMLGALRLPLTSGRRDQGHRKKSATTSMTASRRIPTTPC